jgi:hypothetical protein
VIVSLTPETAVPLDQLKDQLTVLSGYGKSWKWTGHFRGSPTKWKPIDGEAVISALKHAQQNPTVRPVEAATLLGWPRRLKSKTGLVTVPEKEEPAREVTQPEPVAHTETQWRLAKLGCDMGVEVWVARNDRGREWAGHRFTDLPRLKNDLPVQFDEATNRTIELIDLLWLKGNAILAAFDLLRPIAPLGPDRDATEPEDTSLSCCPGRKTKRRHCPSESSHILSCTSSSDEQDVQVHLC